MREGVAPDMESLRSTAVYIDGYNLYYGRVRRTSYKWLDVVKLFEHLLHEQDPEAQLDFVRYFSAPALARFATHGQASTEAQQSYHRALCQLYPEKFAITLGSHSFDRAGTLIPRFQEGQPYRRDDRVRVWKLEEKKTDVNLALAMYRDACSGRFQQMVVCSNDSDVEPALEALRLDFPNLTLGVVAPRHPPRAGIRSHRAVSSSLSQHADWTRHHLRDEELDRAQLPPRLHTGKKPILKPPHW